MTQYSIMTTRETAKIDFFDELESDNFDPSEWPAGQDLLDMLQSHHIETSHGPEYWQVCARWALLNKYKLLKGNHVLEEISARKPVQIVLNGDTVRHLFFTEPEMHAIQERWKECLQALENHTVDTLHNDFYEFLTTGTSNGRHLQWSTMICPPACQFQLHAHPNLELIYCAKGALHEVRLDGEPLTGTFVKIQSDDKDASKLKGPNLSTLDRPWHFATLSQGHWLVNEVGSIHKSFTASKGDGCVLMVLWGGSHANVLPNEAPEFVNVNDTVEQMDARLSRCDCSEWETLAEIFLPDSERRGTKNIDI
ncbi:hypothetical protein MPSEU_000948200 [Mayamaea pseudoterrestris]|nr:hypothetical protein MPSEU_000948200 [Mayamaea pseudoterrestris]